MSVSKTILDETFSLGGNFGGDEIGQAPNRKELSVASLASARPAAHTRLV